MLSILLAVPSCIYSFGMVSSLHSTSFLMIFILTFLLMYYSSARRDDNPIHTYAHAYCAREYFDVTRRTYNQNGVGLNGNCRGGSGSRSDASIAYKFHITHESKVVSCKNHGFLDP